LKAQLKLNCPRCYHEIKLPENGVKGLKYHPFLQRLIEEEKIDANADFPNDGICEFCNQREAISLCSICNQIICNACQAGHKKQKSSKHHEFISLEHYDPRKKAQICHIHPGQELAVFCNKPSAQHVQILNISNMKL